MKLIFIILLSVLSYQCCSGYPLVEGDQHSENGSSIEYWFDSSNETVSNDSLTLDMHWSGNNTQNGINKVKDKAKDIFNKVKDKAKDVFNKVKDKTKDVFNKVKDKIGSKGGSGGGSGGGYYRDRYDRDYDRDKYDRDYNRDKYDRDYYRRDTTSSGGSGTSDPAAIGIMAAFGVIIVVIALGMLIYAKVKGDC